MATNRKTSSLAAGGDGLKWAWALVASAAAIDCVWAWRIGFGFHGFSAAIFVVGFLLSIGLLYDYAGRKPELRDLGHYFALWMAFPLALNIYSYLAATLKFPLCDAQLFAIDASLGFHWFEWHRVIHAHSALTRFLFYVYDSIFIQGFISVAYFALTGNRRRNRELLWIAMLAGLATVVISGFAPALGPQIPNHLPVWSKAFLAVRSGALTSVDIQNMQGIVAFPSFHTVLAITFIYVHRRPSRTFVPIAILNALMLLAIPVMGHHYLIDVIAGAAITAISILAYRMVTAPAEQYDGLPLVSEPALLRTILPERGTLMERTERP